MNLVKEVNKTLEEWKFQSFKSLISSTAEMAKNTWRVLCYVTNIEGTVLIIRALWLFIFLFEDLGGGKQLFHGWNNTCLETQEGNI